MVIGVSGLAFDLSVVQTARLDLSATCVDGHRLGQRFIAFPPDGEFELYLLKERVAAVRRNGSKCTWCRA